MVSAAAVAAHAESRSWSRLPSDPRSELDPWVPNLSLEPGNLDTLPPTTTCSISSPTHPQSTNNSAHLRKPISVLFTKLSISKQHPVSFLTKAYSYQTHQAGKSFQSHWIAADSYRFPHKICPSIIISRPRIYVLS